MPKNEVLSYVIKDIAELNLSFMPFINKGGLFIPTKQSYSLGDIVTVDLQLPKKEILKITGTIIWITPPNALHHVLQGIGIQFTSDNAQNILNQIETNLDPSIEVGGYTYGIFEENKKKK